MTRATKSPTGRFAPAGNCGVRGCDTPAVYELRFADWPRGMRTGSCAEHAPALRRHPSLSRMQTWNGAR